MRVGYFVWGFARAEFFQPVLDELAGVVAHSHLVYLVASPESSERRPIERGEPEKIPHAKTRLALIEQVPCAKIDTSNISAASAADRFADKIRDWIAGAPETANIGRARQAANLLTQM